MNDLMQQIELRQPMRWARVEDLDFLEILEKTCFEVHRQANRKVIKTSLDSKSQLVLMIEDGNMTWGSMTLRLYKNRLRIVSIAVLPEARGRSYGKLMIEEAIRISRQLFFKELSLEVLLSDKKLVWWYESFGFEQKEALEDYYGERRHGVRMVMDLSEQRCFAVVTDYDTDFFEEFDDIRHIRATEYIENPEYINSKNLWIYNFCQNYEKQTVGYYVSLLAMARNHVAIPSASLIRDLDNNRVIKSVGDELSEIIQGSFQGLDENQVVIDSYFGKASEGKWHKLVSAMNTLYHAPLIRYAFVRKGLWSLDRIEILSLEEVKLDKDAKWQAAIRDYFTKARFAKGAIKLYDYDLAILVDPNEALPPSDKEALKQFEKAAAIMGFYVEFITKEDYCRIPEFDALFIRTTTSVNNYTYDFARYAYAEGLVVMDDPWSILRCANKIYLYEALNKAKVAMPKTRIFNANNFCDRSLDDVPFPLILKLPDSAFSKGVYKVLSKDECKAKLDVMFRESDLIVAQEFMPTEYDWRIGVLDGEAFYACKYYMVEDHWQIVKWEHEGQCESEGEFEAVHLWKVPKNVLDTAVRAAAIIGDGLYGVDLKVVNGKAYVIEVNDNPSIENMVEDLVLGHELYLKIMMSFYRRLDHHMKLLRNIH